MAKQSDKKPQVSGQKTAKKRKVKKYKDVSLAIGWIAGGVASLVLSAGALAMGGSVAMVTGMASLFVGGSAAEVGARSWKKFAVGLGIGAAVAFASNGIDSAGELGRKITEGLEKHRDGKTMLIEQPAPSGDMSRLGGYKLGDQNVITLVFNDPASSGDVTHNMATDHEPASLPQLQVA